MTAIRSVQSDDFATLAFMATELLDEVVSVRAEYDVRLAAANRLLSEQVDAIAKLYAALVAVQGHIDRLPAAAADQVCEAVRIIAARRTIDG